jgi:hypothetical protein
MVSMQLVTRMSPLTSAQVKAPYSPSGTKPDWITETIRLQVIQVEEAFETS